MKPEIGQIWRTRGGWCAVITYIKRSTMPVQAVHLEAEGVGIDSDMNHFMNGCVFPNQESDWDLVHLESEAS